MRFRIVADILRKELTETLRDRRTLTMMIVLPVLLYPLLMMGFSKLQLSQREATEGRVSRIAVWGALPSGLGEAIARGGKVAIDDVPPPPPVKAGLDGGTLFETHAATVRRHVGRWARAALDRIRRPVAPQEQPADVVAAAPPAVSEEQPAAAAYGTRTR